MLTLSCWHTSKLVPAWVVTGLQARKAEARVPMTEGTAKPF